MGPEQRGQRATFVRADQVVEARESVFVLRTLLALLMDGDDLGGSLYLLAESVVVQRQALDDGFGPVMIVLEFGMSSLEPGVFGGELVISPGLGLLDDGVVPRLGDEFAGEVGKVAPEGRVVEADLVGQGDDSGLAAVVSGSPDHLGHGGADGVVVG
ncbi:hypothetical protein [Saccharothrix stipae]